MRGIRLAIKPDNLNNAHLQQLVHIRDLVKHLQDIFYCLRHGTVSEEHERVTLARRVRLCCKERLDELWCIGNEVFELLVY